MVDGVDAKMRGHLGRSAVRHLIAVDAQPHPMQARGVEVAARLLGRKETRFAKRVGISRAMCRGGGNYLVDQIVDKGLFAQNSGGRACAPRNVAIRLGTSGSLRCCAIRSSSATSPGLWSA